MKDHFIFCCTKEYVTLHLYAKSHNAHNILRDFHIIFPSTRYKLNYFCGYLKIFHEPVHKAVLQGFIRL